MYAGHKVLMKVDDKILQIFGDPQGILDQQYSNNPLGKYYSYIN
jgi:hypothetical protein